MHKKEGDKLMIFTEEIITQNIQKHLLENLLYL